MAKEDVNDIFEVRKLIEPRAAANAARDLDDQGHEYLKAALLRARKAVASRDAIDLALANVSCRETWLSGVRNQRLAATISRFVDHVQFVRFGTLHDANVQPIVLEGLDAQDEDRLDLVRIAADEGEVLLRPVKPCPRCPIPNIDPVTAESDPVVTDTLQGYRRNDLVGGAVTFGMNAIVLDGIDRTLRVGQTVRAAWKFD